MLTTKPTTNFFPPNIHPLLVDDESDLASIYYSAAAMAGIQVWLARRTLPSRKRGWPRADVQNGSV
ncbi:hypothetical protein [Massilia sp. MS-15]|uniref:hypothetical protein n=1 Tax=Massilia sp. MS-15 TaxID=2878200 RepID=UPI001CD7A6B7|nr:hypothetical protein [Massilia sp. MS-15]MCA1246739.1 hypothetical protein [Massilia sp. MS-15]